ncbi:hypothetical protein TNCV_1397511 [Trichonephila clavipes]|nr:hypothetical protein TNCV_1397511 [Trichonephila clavipes]
MHVKHVEVKSPHVGVMWKFGRGVISSDIAGQVSQSFRLIQRIIVLRVLVAALWDKKLAFRTREKRKFWVFTDGPQRREKKTSSEAVLQLNSASEKKSVLLKEDQSDL